MGDKIGWDLSHSCADVTNVGECAYKLRAEK